MIARAIVAKPRIMLFDEATSALDNRTQEIVSHAMEQMSAGQTRVTRLVIAHRLSTIVKADRIIVLDKGLIVQTGTYDELVNQEGFFANLARRQLA
jgi:ABC-type multidrug transport system fused ATPase/permease subunit